MTQQHLEYILDKYGKEFWYGGFDVDFIKVSNIRIKEHKTGWRLQTGSVTLFYGIHSECVAKQILQEIQQLEILFQ